MLLGRPFKCKDCGIFFTGNRLEMKNFPKWIPTGSNQGETKSIEHVCSSETLEKVEFSLHPIWSCDHCPEKFADELERDTHLQTAHHTEITPNFSCCGCPKKFSLLAEWLIHRGLEHPEMAQVSCYYCHERFEIPTTSGVSYPDYKSIRAHMRDAHRSQHKMAVFPIHECEFCGQQFQVPRLLVVHVESKHSLPALRMNSCPYCFFRKRFLGGIK